MVRMIHPIAGTLAILVICCFWFSTVFSGLFGTQEHIVAVKTAIPWAFLILIPSLVITGASGFQQSAGRRTGLLGKKAKRMMIVAPTGVFVLIPAALFLAYKADWGEFDTSYYLVQFIELIAGAMNLGLMSMNMRDGLKLRGRLA